MTQKTYPRIYKRDTKGKLRVWFMEQDGPRHCTHSGLNDGAITVTEWTLCETTNAGRSNERDPVAQATFEIEASYENKLSREYHRTIEATEEGAHFFQPMLAKTYDHNFMPGYAQPKLDGARCIATIEGMFSRQGKELPGAKHIHELLAPLFEVDPDLILDGELYNHDLKEDFGAIISMVKKANPSPERQAEIEQHLQYHIYDLPSCSFPFNRRYTNLKLLFGEIDTSSIRLVETIPVNYQTEFDRAHGQFLAQGYEGSIWRDSAPYENKRSKYLLKRKEKQDAEFKLLRIEPGLGNWSGLAKRAVCQLPDGREFSAGIKGSMSRAKTLLDEHHTVVTIEFFEYTPDGIPRFPIATKFWGTERTL